MSGKSESALADTRRWMRFAQDDINLAVHLHTAKVGTPRHVCWLSQQAAEKALKAALTYEEEDFSFTHDVEALSLLLPNTWRIGVPPDELARLTSWAVEARYPGEWLEPDDNQAAEAIDLGQRVCDAIGDELGRQGIIG